SLFRRNIPIGPLVDLFAIDALRLFPELIAARPHLTANEIHGNPHQPRIHAALSSKGSAAFVSVPEAILSQRLCEIHIAERGEQKPQYSHPVLLHHAIEILQIPKPGFPCSRQSTRTRCSSSFVLYRRGFCCRS